jgi:hypothetical protein
VYRLRTILAFSFLVFAACSSAVAAQSGAIVIQVREYPDGGFKRIQATDKLVVDAEGFLFPGERDNSDSPPDTIALHIQHDCGSYYYSTPFSTEQRRYELSPKSLRARGGAPPFIGFPQGASAFLLVGTEVGGFSLDIGVFADQWNLMLRVE